MLIASNIVTLSLTIVVIKGLKPINKLSSNSVGIGLIRISLLLVIYSMHSSYIYSIGSLNLLKHLKERLLYRYIGVLTIPTPTTLPT